MSFQRPILWVHEEALGPRNPALLAWPEAPALFVFDAQWIEEAQISRKRLGFLYESALDLPLTLRQGDVAAEVMALVFASVPPSWRRSNRISGTARLAIRQGTSRTTHSCSPPRWMAPPISQCRPGGLLR